MANIFLCILKLRILLSARRLAGEACTVKAHEIIESPLNMTQNILKCKKVPMEMALNKQTFSYLTHPEMNQANQTCRPRF